VKLLNRVSPTKVRPPKHPYPMWLRRVLRRVLFERIYRRYVGRHEDESLRRWTRMAGRVGDGKAVLDIGAYHGDYALAAREANARVDIYAFEPNTHALDVLRGACQGRSIEIVAAAVSDEAGDVSFSCRSAESAISTQEPASDADQELVTVTAISLDAWVSERSVIPALLKIDVEGWEARILRGASRAISEYRPVILCEVLTDAAGEDVRSALPSFYRFFRVDENRGVTEETRLTRRTWRNKNWLLVPEERRGEMLNLPPVSACPECNSMPINRSRASSVSERVRKRYTAKRLYRCPRCGWRGWALPFEGGHLRPEFIPEIAPLAADAFASLDVPSKHETGP
jgi:FkbM family methyltransferase